MMSGDSNFSDFFQGLPHVDQVLCERYGLGVARDSDSAVHIAARFTILAVGDANHSSTKLSATKINLFQY